MFNKLKNIFGFNQSTVLDYRSGLWIDNDLEIYSAIHDKNLRMLMKDFEINGYIKLNSLISNDLCDRINEDFINRAKTKYRNYEIYLDEYGLHTRLCNYHMDSELCLELAFNEYLMKILDLIFQRKAMLWSSLYFEKGSEQRIHRDTPFFFTQPKNLFVGVWVALEDVKENSGELVYYPKGHLENILPDNIKNEYGICSWEEYCQEIENKCLHNNLKLEKNLAKKGDVLIWHPELPHGGSKRLNHDVSRKSIVFHFKALDVPLYGSDTFFNKIIKNNYHEDKLIYKDRYYINQGDPFFNNNNY